MRKLIFSLGVILLFAACVPRVQVIRLSPAIYPPSVRPVDILQSKPTGLYYAFAGVCVDMRNIKEPYQAIDMLAKAAQDIGGDALLLLGVEEIGQKITLIGQGFFQTGSISPDHVLMGAVIRYAPEPFVVRRTNLTFPPHSIDEGIKVITTKTKPADREYIELAEISCEFMDLKQPNFKPENTLLILYEAARKMGADALIILSQEEKAGPMAGMMVGIAIRYKTSK